MNVTITHVPLLGLPPPTGPHELAWSYILDAVFADAYHAGVGHMDVVLPSTGLAEATETRAALCAVQNRGVCSAIALLGGPMPVRDGYERAYAVRFGTLAPRALRRLTNNAMGDMTLEDELGVFTPAARLWGVPIRLAAMARRPDLVDRSLAAMRHGFAVQGNRHAFYRLLTWGRP